VNKVRQFIALGHAARLAGHWGILSLLCFIRAGRTMNSSPAAALPVVLKFQPDPVTK